LCRAFLSGVPYLLRGRLFPYATTALRTTNGVERRFLKIKVNSTKKRNSEFDYYPAEWTPMDFIKFLDSLGVRYVALRWHDKIVNNLPMKDLDILIDDEDIHKVSAGLDKFVGRKMVDMHSVGGGERQKVDQMAYFPPKISRRILENRVPLTAEGGYRPSDHDYFLSLAYHAVVDKGAASGLPETGSGPADPENKYYKELARLKNVLGIEADLNLAALMAYLEKSGWLPPADRLAKFSARNAWLENKIKSAPSKAGHIEGSYSVFLFREIVREWGILPELIADLKEMGFETVFEKNLAGEEREHICAEIRGGNWSPGPWQTGGGKPFHAVLVRDPKPIKMSRKQLMAYPAVENAHFLHKGKWRDRINSRFPKAKQANFVHASDNTHETYEYMSVIAPDALNLMK